MSLGTKCSTNQISLVILQAKVTCGFDASVFNSMRCCFSSIHNLCNASLCHNYSTFYTFLRHFPLDLIAASNNWCYQLDWIKSYCIETNERVDAKVPLICYWVSGIIKSEQPVRHFVSNIFAYQYAIKLRDHL